METDAQVPGCTTWQMTVPPRRQREGGQPAEEGVRPSHWRCLCAVDRRPGEERNRDLESAAGK